MSNQVSIERLRAMFDVTPDGLLIRKIARPGRSWVGTVAGCMNSHGYILVMVDKVHLKAHRIVWALENGKWPEGQIDHINGIRHDNRIENLRDVPPIVNARNRRDLTGSKSGLLGAYKNGSGYVAKTKRGGISVCFGTYPSAAEAHEAYKAGVALFDAKEAARVNSR
jgi:hypothetical protein